VSDEREPTPGEALAARYEALGRRVAARQLERRTGQMSLDEPPEEDDADAPD
jgi:hypothetical protein